MMVSDGELYINVLWAIAERYDIAYCTDENINKRDCYRLLAG
jgi:hypothetical protein